MYNGFKIDTVELERVLIMLRAIKTEDPAVSDTLIIEHYQNEKDKLQVYCTKGNSKSFMCYADFKTID